MSRRAELPADLDLEACAREPIHIPGSVQAHGVLLALSEPDLVVRVASANALDVLGRPAEELVGRPLAFVLAGEGARLVADALEREHPGDANPIRVELATAAGPPRDAEAVLHRSGGLAVCELELVDGRLELPAFIHGVSRSMAALQQERGAVAVSERAVAEIRRLTGYERVLAYRFHPDDHGEVIAEARDPAVEPFLGLHYPATDIPAQARALYLRQTLRLIADVDAPAAPLVPALVELPDRPRGGPEPLDLSCAVLRSSSPVHLQYLRNMGVQATMTISLVRDDRLWGLIACHHPEPLHVPYGVRAACEVLGQLLSFRLAREEETDLEVQRQARSALHEDLLARIFAFERLGQGFESAGELALRLVDADGLVGSVGGERIAIGAVAPPAAERLLADLAARDGVTATAHLRGLVGDGVDLGEVAGALAVPLPPGVGEHLVWFRREWRHTVVWGGDPDKVVAPAPTGTGHVLSPRASFAAWTEEVRDRSRRWSGTEEDAAAQLVSGIAEQLLRSVRDQLAHVALHDPLTGLANRTLLLERLGQLLALRPREGADRVGVLFVDLDRFKQVNDTLGHGAGDQLLRQVGERLSSIGRDGDVVARVGGDEFVVGTEPVRHEGDVTMIAERIMEAMRRPFVLEGRSWFVTASVGVASAELASRPEPAALLRDADAALYEAKRGGRNRQARFDEDLLRRRTRRMEVENRLRGALDREELRLAYQPIFAADGRLEGAEALLRWANPVLGEVTPGEFVPVAEELGLVERLGDWVIETALARLSALRAGHATAADLVMSVNLSARQLADEELPTRIAGLLQETGVPADRLWFEITESVLMGGESSREQAVLERLRSQGVRVAIDDFGTGFSSLAYLRQLPVDLLKIDRAFVSGLEEGRADAAVVSSIIELARQLELRTVAEGIETERQRAEVVRLGAEMLQGFLLGRPLEDGALVALVARGSHPHRSG